MIPIASEPIYLGTHPLALHRVAGHQDGLRGDAGPGNGTPVVAPSGRVRVIGRDEDVNVSSAMRSWRTLTDGVALLGVVWSIPVAVLILGTPVALVLAFLLRLMRRALGAL